MDKFYVVWNPNGQNPSKRHDNAYTARMEAERLAKITPNQDFFVLEATGVAKVETPSIYKTIGCPF